MQYVDIEDIAKAFIASLTGKEPESWEQLEDKINIIIDDVPEINKKELRQILELDSEFNPNEIDMPNF